MKSVVVAYNTPDIPSITLYGEEVPKVDQTVHLGICRNSECNPDIGEKKHWDAGQHTLLWVQTSMVSLLLKRA